MDGISKIIAEKKLRAKAREGYSGGLKPSFRPTVAKMLMDHAEQLAGVCPHCKVHDGEHDHEEEARQAVDVCNLALMLWLVDSPSATTKRGRRELG